MCRRGLGLEFPIRPIGESNVMAAKDPSRVAHFPAIEKKYGEKMKYWFTVIAKLEGKKYPEQIAHLRDKYGFSQAHANALVMYSRGSTSARRFDKPADYYKTITPQHRLVPRYDQF